MLEVSYTRKKNTITVNKAYIKQIKPTLLKNTKM